MCSPVTIIAQQRNPGAEVIRFSLSPCQDDFKLETAAQPSSSKKKHFLFKVDQGCLPGNVLSFPHFVGRKMDAMQRWVWIHIDGDTWAMLDVLLQLT